MLQPQGVRDKNPGRSLLRHRAMFWSNPCPVLLSRFRSSHDRLAAVMMRTSEPPLDGQRRPFFPCRRNRKGNCHECDGLAATKSIA